MAKNVSRRTVMRSSGVTLLGTLAGCFQGQSESTSGRHVPADWRPAPGEWASADAYDPGWNLYNPHASPPANKPELAWEADFEQTNPYPRFSIADGKLFLRTESALTALDTENGDKVWDSQQDELGYIVYIDDRLYHSTRTHGEALTLDGEVEWTVDKSVRFMGEKEGDVYMGTDDGLAWYDADTGDKLGSTEKRPAFYGVVGGKIFGFTDDVVYAYEHDGDEPTQIWETPVEEDVEIQGNWRTVADGTLYVRERAGPYEKRLGRYNFENGSVETTGRTYDEIYSLIVAGGVEYTVTLEQDEEGHPQTFSLTARNDEVQWERSFDTFPRTPIVTDDLVLLGGDEGELLALDAESGDTVWDRPESGGMLAVVNDTIYVFRNGRLLAFR